MTDALHDIAHDNETPAGELALRVRAYLRCMGLSDQRLLDAATQRAMQRLADTGVSDAAGDPRQAVDLMRQWSQAWMDDLLKQTHVNPQHAALVGFCVRRRLMIARGPLADGAVFPTVDAQTLCPGLGETGAAAPAETPGEMPTQSLAKLPHVLRRRYWRRRLRRAGRTREQQTERTTQE